MQGMEAPDSDGRPFQHICLQCGEAFRSCFTNWPPCPKCGHLENRWFLLRGYEELVPHPREATVENFNKNIKIDCKITLR